MRENTAVSLVLTLIVNTVRSRDSSGSIVSDYGLDDRSGFDPQQGQRIFPLFSVSRPALEPSASCPVDTGGSFPGGKARPGRDADHSPPSSAEVVSV
jgi:hypothetical protein